MYAIDIIIPEICWNCYSSYINGEFEDKREDRERYEHDNHIHNMLKLHTCSPGLQDNNVHVTTSHACSTILILTIAITITPQT